MGNELHGPRKTIEASAQSDAHLEEYVLIVVPSAVAHTDALATPVHEQSTNRRGSVRERSRCTGLLKQTFHAV